MASGQKYADAILEMWAGTTAKFTSVYVSLHSGDPGATGANEHTWSNYARQKLVSATWATPSGTAGSNRHTAYAAAVTFSTVGTATEGQKAIYLGIWDAASSGSFLAGGALNTSVTLNSNVVPSFATSALQVEQD